MIAKFPRHAKRRAKLYNISESIVEKILKDADLRNVEHEIIINLSGFKYSVKIVANKGVQLFVYGIRSWQQLTPDGLLLTENENEF